MITEAQYIRDLTLGPGNPSTASPPPDPGSTILCAGPGGPGGPGGPCGP